MYFELYVCSVVYMYYNKLLNGVAQIESRISLSATLHFIWTIKLLGIICIMSHTVGIRSNNAITYGVNQSRNQA